MVLFEVAGLPLQVRQFRRERHGMLAGPRTYLEDVFRGAKLTLQDVENRCRIACGVFGIRPLSH